MKSLLAMTAIIALNIFIHSFILNNQKDVKVPEYLYGVPTYPNARFYLPMSSLDADPCVAAFLTNDSAETVVDFYKKKMNMPPKDIFYGKTGGMLIHQFGLEKSDLRNSIVKGVEILAFNSFNRRVYNASTKIKIYVSRKEVEEVEKNNQKTIPVKSGEAANVVAKETIR